MIARRTGTPTSPPAARPHSVSFTTASTPAPANFVLNGTPVTAPGGVRARAAPAARRTSQQALGGEHQCAGGQQQRQQGHGLRRHPFGPPITWSPSTTRRRDFTAAGGHTKRWQYKGTFDVRGGETTKQVRSPSTVTPPMRGNESLLLVLSPASEFSTSKGVGLVVNDDANPNVRERPEYHVVGYFAEMGDTRGHPGREADRHRFANIRSMAKSFHVLAATDREYPGDTWDQPAGGQLNQLAS